MCQGTEERGQISRACETAEANLTQASVDDKRLVPCCLAALVRHLFAISTALRSCQQPPGFGLMFVKKTFCSAPTDFGLQLSSVGGCLCVVSHLEI